MAATAALIISIVIPTMLFIFFVALSIAVAKYFIMPHRFSFWAPVFFFFSFFPLLLVIADISLAAKFGADAQDGKNDSSANRASETDLMRALYNALALIVAVCVFAVFPVLVVFLSAMRWRRHRRQQRTGSTRSPAASSASPLLNSGNNRENRGETEQQQESSSSSSSSCACLCQWYSGMTGDGRKLFRYCLVAFLFGIGIVTTLCCVGAFVFPFRPYIGEIVGNYSAWFAQVYRPLQHSAFNRAGAFVFTGLALLGIVPFAVYTSFGMVHVPFVFLWGPPDIVGLAVQYKGNMQRLGRVDGQLEPLTREGVSSELLKQRSSRGGGEASAGGGGGIGGAVTSSSFAFVVAAYRGSGGGGNGEKQPSVTELEQAEYHYTLSQARHYLNSQIKPVQSVLHVADRLRFHALHDGASPAAAEALRREHLADPSGLASSPESSSFFTSETSTRYKVRRVASTLTGVALLFVSLSIAAGMIQAHINAALHSTCGNKCGAFLVDSHRSWPNPLDIFLARLFQVPLVGEIALSIVFVYMLSSCFCGMSVLGVRVPPCVGDCCVGGKDTSANRKWANLLFLRRKVTTPSRFFAATVCMMLASVCFAVQLMFASPHFFTFSTQNFFATSVPCDVLELGANTNCEMTELSKQVFGTTLSRPWLASVFFFTGVTFDALFVLSFAYRFFSGRPTTLNRITHFDAI